MHHFVRLALAATFVAGCVDNTPDDDNTAVPTEDTSAATGPDFDPTFAMASDLATGAFDEDSPAPGVDPSGARYQHTIDPAGCFTCSDLAWRAESYCNTYYSPAYTQQGTCYRSTCSSRWDRVSFNCVIWTLH